jgi:hypothetical protein
MDSCISKSCRAVDRDRRTSVPIDKSNAPMPEAREMINQQPGASVVVTANRVRAESPDDAVDEDDRNASISENAIGGAGIHRWRNDHPFDRVRDHQFNVIPLLMLIVVVVAEEDLKAVAVRDFLDARATVAKK